MSIKAITFDLDDTFWAINPVIERAEAKVHQWLAQHFPEIANQFSVEQLRRLRELVGEEMTHVAHDFTEMRKETFRRASEQCGYAPEDVVDRAFDVFIAARHEVEFFEGVLTVLDSISNRYILGALTNGNADLKRLGIDHHFEFQLCAANVGKAKPHPLMFEQACALIDADPHQVVHVGDHPEHDIDGAKAIGMRTVWMNPEAKAWPGNTKPDAEISSLPELLPLLRQW